MYNGHPIYIKLNSSRVTPWNFTFTKDHLDEIELLYKENCSLSIILICNNDGMAILDYVEYSKVLSVDNGIYPKWIKASRKKREKYTITGSDGILTYKIGMEKISQFIDNFKKRYITIDDKK